MLNHMLVVFYGLSVKKSAYASSWGAQALAPQAASAIQRCLVMRTSYCLLYNEIRYLGNVTTDHGLLM